MQLNLSRKKILFSIASVVVVIIVYALGTGYFVCMCLGAVGSYIAYPFISNLLGNGSGVDKNVKIQKQIDSYNKKIVELEAKKVKDGENKK